MVTLRTPPDIERPNGIDVGIFVRSECLPRLPGEGT